MCGSNPVLPCIIYIKGTTLPIPSPGAQATDANGAFIVIGLTPGTPITAKVFGVTTAGQAATQIGELTVNGKAGAVSLGATTPLRQ